MLWLVWNRKERRKKEEIEKKVTREKRDREKWKKKRTKEEKECRIQEIKSGKIKPKNRQYSFLFVSLGWCSTDPNRIEKGIKLMQGN